MEDSVSSVEREVDEKTMLNQIEELKIWITNQPTIPELSDKTLEKFLHSCIYDVSATKKTLLVYFKLRMESPFYFSDRNPCSSSMTSLIKNVFCFMLPEPTEEGYRVIMCGYFPCTDDYVFKENMKRFMMQADMWLSKLDVCAGFVVIIDNTHFSLSHLTSGSPFDAVKKLSIYFQEALPVRLKRLLFINISAATNMLLTMAHPILSKTIRSLMYKYQCGDKGYLDFFPKKCLPREFGGELGTITELNEAAQKELEDSAEWFNEQDRIISSLLMKNAPPSSKEKQRSFLFF